MGGLAAASRTSVHERLQRPLDRAAGNVDHQRSLRRGALVKPKAMLVLCCFESRGYCDGVRLMGQARFGAPEGLREICLGLRSLRRRGALLFPLHHI